MKSRFVRSLQQFLEQENISVDSGIVNDITYRLAGVQAKEKHLSTGFSFRSTYSHYYDLDDDSDDEESSKKEEQLFFSLPAFNLEQLHHVLALFNISVEAYKVNKPLALDNDWLLTNFLPRFKEHFLRMKVSDPQTIAKYKIASAPILESSAETTITNYASEARKILISDPLKILPDTYQQLFNVISILASRLQYIEKNPHLYAEIPKTCQILDGFKSMPEVNTNQDLVSKLNMIQEGIQLYVKYNRNESVLALMTFNKELKSFLANYRISAASCDILEDVLLDLSGANRNSVSPSTFDIGSDPSRLTIRYEDINKQNIQKVIDYLFYLGDETVCEGYGGRHYGSVMAENTRQCFVVRESVPVKKTESHSIEMDGKFFYNVVFPLVKAKISSLPQEKLAAYQELSKEQFPDKLPKVTPVSMFQEEKPTNVVAPLEINNSKRLRTGM